MTQFIDVKRPPMHKALLPDPKLGLTGDISLHAVSTCDTFIEAIRWGNEGTYSQMFSQPTH